MSLKTASVALLAALFGNSKADQPVHCVKSQVLGTWDFVMSQEKFDIDLFKAKEVCTHRLPNK